uniref:calpain-7-like isoform X1 n=1 Tax=Styela clava TaxID=7725 RepID=UPI00193AB941|nr:calpain-7-like isoform X1 [Styela clava]
MDPTGLEQDGFKFAKSAVELDEKGHYIEAIFYYKEAIEALRNAAIAGSKIDCAAKADEYSKRVEELAKFLAQKTQQQSIKRSPSHHTSQDEQRGKFLIKQALEQDEKGNENEALELYLQAAELCIKARDVPGTTPASRKQLEGLAKQALTRAEDIKGIKKMEDEFDEKIAGLPDVVNNDFPPINSSKTENKNAKAKPKSPNPPRKPLGPDFTKNDGRNTSAPNPFRPTVSQSRPSTTTAQSSGGGYTKEEIAVLRSTSFINKREYVPFMSVDLRERFAFPVPFTDKSGLLELSAKQKKRLKSWMRPNEFAEDPQMIMAVSSFSIKQTVVSDCSFVASLAISAAYERRFRKKLITSIIYPQNKKGEPMYNPCGKYMVKLNLNGVPRKVIIDDYLPCDNRGELLCSYSSNRNELWVALIEKAYLKVMGGYDFPGSNSNIDLHALTGWIPERQSLREDTFNKDHFFDKIFDRFHKGHCLATISTGPMTPEEEDRTGLVPTHAYAVLDIRKVQGLQMLQLKNPWSHLRWKGRYGAEDEERWTPKLRKALNYDNKLAQQYDNGVFWIDYDSALHFYDTFYVSWNPDLFPKTTCCHYSWMAHDGPEKDSYSLGDNPQFSLEVRNPQQSAVWVLLTRHITDKDDFAQNQEFITMLVYKNEGKRVYYPHSPSPYIDGVRINSPHYLTRIQVPAAKTSPNRFTLVVSQYEKHKNIQYTIRVYATAEFALKKILDPYKFKKRISGNWTKENAGGCANHRDTYNRNPIYQINLNSQQQGNIKLLIELRGPKVFSVGFDVSCVDTKNGDKPFKQEMSGNFRSGYSMLELDVPPGIYNIIPCTFMQNKISPFFLDISTSCEGTKIVKVK